MWGKVRGIMLCFEQVSEEVIEQYRISEGRFYTVSDCKYVIPGVVAIGRDCRIGLYFEDPSFLECSYQEGSLL